MNGPERFGRAVAWLAVAVTLSPLLWVAAKVWAWLPMLTVLQVALCFGSTFVMVLAVKKWGLVGLFERLKDGVRRVIESPAVRRADYAEIARLETEIYGHPLDARDNPVVARGGWTSPVDSIGRRDRLTVQEFSALVAREKARKEVHSAEAHGMMSPSTPEKEEQQ